MVKWLEENRHSDFLKTTVKPDWENLKKLTTVQEGFVVLTDTGEIVDGVTAAYAPDEFIVKI